MKLIIYLFINYLDIFLFYYLLQKSGLIDYEKKRKIWITLLLLIPITLTIGNQLEIFRFQFILMCVACIFMMCFLPKVSLKKKLKYLLLYLAIDLGSEILTIFLLDIVYNVTMYELFRMPNVFYLSLLISEILKLGLITVHITIINLRDYRVHGKDILPFLCMPISTLFIILGSTNYKTVSQPVSGLFIIGVFGLLLFNLVLILMMTRFAKTSRMEAKLQVLHEKVAFDALYTKLLEKKRKDTRIFSVPGMGHN